MIILGLQYALFGRDLIIVGKIGSLPIFPKIIKSLPLVLNQVPHTVIVLNQFPTDLLGYGMSKVFSVHLKQKYKSFSLGYIAFPEYQNNIM